VEKEVQMVEDPGRIQLPDLSQKMKDQKTECSYYKT
jgi:thiamine biosynthesis protein ThiC